VEGIRIVATADEERLTHCRPDAERPAKAIRHCLKQAGTGCPLLVNTSFNVRGEPIVNTPARAYRCFWRTEMDVLADEN
jgi:predicted NodU family carbamoyl transferase